MSIIRATAVAAACIGVAAPLLAGIPAKVGLRTSVAVCADPKKVGRNLLTNRYVDGDWKGLSDDLSLIVRTLVKDPTQNGDEGCGTETAVIDLKRDFAIVLWTGKVSGEMKLLHVVLHEGVDPYADELVDVGGGGARLFELFLSDTPKPLMESHYTSTAVDDPVLAQVPAFVGAILSPAVAFASSASSKIDKAVKEPPPPKVLFGTIAEVTLPMKRAQVQATFLAEEPLVAARVVQAAMELRDAVTFTDAGNSVCAAGLADSLCAVVRDMAQRTRLINADDLLESLRGPMQERYAKTVSDCGVVGTAIQQEQTLKAIDAVDRQFRQLIAGLDAKKISGEAIFTTAPTQRIGFGVATAFASAPWHASRRVKVDGGKVVDDPLGRQLSLVTVNISPAGFRPHAATISPSERYRVFVGAIVTPDFGVAAGGSVLLMRGLSINVGVGALLVKTPGTGNTVDGAPKDANNPFSLGVTVVPFIGLAYNFK